MSEDSSTVSSSASFSSLVDRVKKKNNNLDHAKQDFDKIHYSINIPSKNIEDYKLLKSFNTFARLKNWLESKYNINITIIPIFQNYKKYFKNYEKKKNMAKLLIFHRSGGKKVKKKEFHIQYLNLV